MFWLCYAYLTSMTTVTLKTESLYCACSPELGLVSYGQCRDEAINNLLDEVRVLAGKVGEQGSDHRGN
jgi:hypothetical protein